MDQEIANCLIRGENPILPPELFVMEAKEDIGSSVIMSETEGERKKRKNIKRSQHFRRVFLKKRKQQRGTIPHTPSALYHHSTVNESFSRDKHDYYVKKQLECKEADQLDLEGKSESELQQVVENQKKQIGELNQENTKLSYAIYRIKKQLRQIVSM